MVTRSKAKLAPNRTHKSAWGISIAVITLGLVLSGCSSTDSQTKSEGSLKQGIEAAQSLIAQHSAAPAFVEPGPKLDAKKFAGKKVLVLQNDQRAQQIVNISNGIKEAVDAVGLDATYFNGEGTPTKHIQGIEQAISQGVSAIILVGVVPDQIPAGIKAANDAHIPVIATTIGVPISAGIFATSSPDFVVTGELMAASAIVHANGKPVVAANLTFTNPAVPQAVAGMKTMFDKCGGECQIIATNNIEPPNWATQATTTAAALAKAHPDLNYIFTSVDDTFGTFAASGVKQARADVKVIGAQGSGAGPLGVLKEGDILIADPGQSAYWIGWGGVDQALRALSGMAPGNNEVPVTYIDQAFLKDRDVNDLSQIYGTSYVDGFRKVWGLS